MSSMGGGVSSDAPLSVLLVGGPTCGARDSSAVGIVRLSAWAPGSLITMGIFGWDAEV